MYKEEEDGYWDNDAATSGLGAEGNDEVTSAYAFDGNIEPSFEAGVFDHHASGKACNSLLFSQAKRECMFDATIRWCSLSAMALKFIYLYTSDMVSADQADSTSVSASTTHAVDKPGATSSTSSPMAEKEREEQKMAVVKGVWSRFLENALLVCREAKRVF